MFMMTLRSVVSKLLINRETSSFCFSNILMYSKKKPRETLRFEGNKTNRFSWGTCHLVHCYRAQRERAAVEAVVKAVVRGAKVRACRLSGAANIRG